jgi:hypothetical protein
MPDVTHQVFLFINMERGLKIEVHEGFTELGVDVFLIKLESTRNFVKSLCA